MHLHKLHIVNFRAIRNIEVTFDAPVTVIIGPNASGKTTILEAIRLAKGVLAPRSQNESNQVLTSLGVISPHMPQQIFPSAITTQPNRETAIKCTYAIDDIEIARIRALQPQMASNLALQSAGFAFAAPAQAVAFFSSQAGIAAVTQASNALNDELRNIETHREVKLNLLINAISGNLRGEFPVHQMLFAALEQSLAPSSTLFSYFPADRALPPGEPGVQIGSGDAANQIESYNSQPQVKYHRLKNAIFNSIIEGPKGREKLASQFELIFSKILRGRSLGDIGVNQLGMLSIPIRDLESGAEFQIDGLSSGEKGLILTFLLIAQNVAEGGLVLLDEPELHLNPAVCRDLLQFFVDEYADKSRIQGIICSHSAEILTGTFERDACQLFHLRDGSTLARVRHKDRGEIRDALRRLGSSESEALLYRGTISVEGEHDEDILQTGFDDLLRRYRVRERGGRREIEKDIGRLQTAEKNGEEIGNHYFIFDMDRQPTTLSESRNVKLLQWNRYCLENFLLDEEILTDLSREPAFSDRPMGTLTEMNAVLKRVAMGQLSEFVVREVFREFGLEKIGFEMKGLGLGTLNRSAADISNQMNAISGNLVELQSAGFEEKFKGRCMEQFQKLQGEWEICWKTRTNGKKVFNSLRAEGFFKGDLLKLKKSIITQMKNRKTAEYEKLEHTLTVLISER